MEIICPPPTSSDLPARQRIKLVRSARKITQVLGTLPRIIDDRAPGPHDVPEEQPFGNISLDLEPCRLASPSLLSPTTPESPLSPTFWSEIEAPQRWQKIAKLTQTFGELVPPHLVYPEPRVVPRRMSMSGDLPGHVQQSSQPTLRRSRTQAQKDRPTGPSQGLGEAKELDRHAQSSRTSSPREAQGSPLNRPESPSTPRISRPLPLGVTSGTRSRRRPRSVTSAAPPSTWSARPNQRGASLDVGATNQAESVHICPSEDGAWSHRSIHDVRNGLRKLKAK